MTGLASRVGLFILYEYTVFIFNRNMTIPAGNRLMGAVELESCPAVIETGSRPVCRFMAAAAIGGRYRIIIHYNIHGKLPAMDIIMAALTFCFESG